MQNNLAYKDEFREERINGKITAMAPTPTNHNRIAENIDFIFRLYLRNLKGKRCVPFGDGESVFLTKNDEFIPDFMIVCNRNKIKHDGVYGAPDLVVEVLSPSTAKNDRGYKKSVYESSGVPEYWLVDPLHRSVEVYLLQDGRYVLDNLYTLYHFAEAERITDRERAAQITEFKCHLYDDLIIHLDDIFSDLF